MAELYSRPLPIATYDDEIPDTFSEQLRHYRQDPVKPPEEQERYYILSIETSCDDACAAIVSSDGDVVAEEHASNPESLVRYGGIKPDEYQRFHIQHIDSIIQRAIDASGVNMNDVKHIAVTRGPGMNICLKVGYEAALRLSRIHGIPVVGENHLAGHCLSPFIKGHQFKVTPGYRTQPSTNLEYPFLALLLSGGHSQIYVVESASQFHMLGDTMDNYAGNVLHKCAKELGLPIHNGGGPSIEEAARRVEGEPLFDMTEPCKDMCFTSFCFSGIQTQLRDLLIKLKEQYGDHLHMKQPDLVDHLAHTCQEVVFKQILRQVQKTLDISDNLFGIRQLVLVGGVSCNERLRQLLANMLQKRSTAAKDRQAAFINRMYGHAKKSGAFKRFHRNDTNENILINNLMDRLQGVDTVADFLELLWKQDLYPDLLQRKEGIHLSVQQKNSLYSACIQAYLSLLKDAEARNLRCNLFRHKRSGLQRLQASQEVLFQLAQLEQREGSQLITRSFNGTPATNRRWELFTTSRKYCTDNAVMIAYSLLEKHRVGLSGLADGIFKDQVTDEWNLAKRRHWELLSDIAVLHSFTED